METHFHLKHEAVIICKWHMAKYLVHLSPVKHMSPQSLRAISAGNLGRYLFWDRPYNLGIFHDFKWLTSPPLVDFRWCINDDCGFMVFYGWHRYVLTIFIFNLKVGPGCECISSDTLSGYLLGFYIQLLCLRDVRCSSEQMDASSIIDILWNQRIGGKICMICPPPRLLSEGITPLKINMEHHHGGVEERSFSFLKMGDL